MRKLSKRILETDFDTIIIFLKGEIIMFKPLSASFLSEGELNELTKLFPINVDDEIKSIPAYEVWLFLGKPQGEFNKWIKRYLHDEKYGFIPGMDYAVFSHTNGFFDNSVEKSKGRPKKDFHVTINCAKELCILARTLKGKQLRKYFIYVENQISNQSLTATTSDNDALEEFDSMIVRLEKIQKLDPELRIIALGFARNLGLINK